MLSGNSSKRDDIQGLRAVAVLVVVAFHAGLPLPGGFSGVDIFFVISGYVIARMLSQELAVSGRIDFWAFYARRCRRLLPALGLMTAGTTIVAFLLLSPSVSQQPAAKTAIGAMLLSGNFVVSATSGGYFDAPAHSNPLLHTWSLAVEEQFYLLFPVSLWVLWRSGRCSSRRFGRRWLLGSFAALAVVASFVAAAIGSSRAFPEGIAGLLGFYSPVTRTWEFLVGVILALKQHRIGIADRESKNIIEIAGVSTLVLSMLLISERVPYPGPWTLLPVVGVALLLATGGARDTAFSKLLSSAPMVKVGDWSYSIYLWHWPCLVFAEVVAPGQIAAKCLALAIALVAALSSYYLVEQPIRVRRDWTGLQMLQLVGAFVVLPVTMGAMLNIASTQWFWNTELRQRMEMMSTYPTGWRDPLCISRVPVDRRDTNGCQWWPASPGVPIYLLGDSNALHFSDSIIAAGEQLGRSVAALGSDGCPFADVYLERTSDPSLRIQCRAAYEAMLKWVVEKPHGLVVIASVDRYWRDSDYLVGEDASMRGAEIRMNAVRMNSGLRATVEILLKTGHSVVLMQTIPHFVAPPYRIEETPCNGWSIAFGECQLPAGAMPIEFANALQRMSRDGIREISRDTGAFVFDLRDYFCVAGICSTKSADGEDYYMRDGYHLNQLGSSRLKDKFAAYLSGLPNRQ